jgi:hypothetical protein
MPTLSIDFTVPQAQRMATAVGGVMRLGRDATPAEVKQYWVDEMKRLVKNVEYESAARQITSTSLDIT